MLWDEVIWVGKHVKTDEHLLLLPEGVFGYRSLRRLVGSTRWNRELLDDVVEPLDCEPTAGEDITMRLQALTFVASPVPRADVGDQANASEVKDPAADLDLGDWHSSDPEETRLHFHYKALL